MAAPETRPQPLPDAGRAASGGLRLGAAERRAWREDGFFVRRGAFGADELAALCAAAERVVRAAAQACEASPRRWEVDGNVYVETLGATLQLEHLPGSRTLRVVEPFHHLDPRFDALIDDPRIVEPMRDLVGSERVALFTDKLNLKRPHEGSRFRWHQDSPYWAHFCQHLERLPNVLLALDDADEENGCLRVVRGSHRHGLLPGCQGEGRLGPLFTDPSCFDAADQVPAVMLAGSLIFFHPHSVHGSEPNRSARERRALVLTYQPGGLRQFKVDAVRGAGAL